MRLTCEKCGQPMRLIMFIMEPPVVDWMKKQGRFKHLFKPGNEHVLEYTQNFVDKEWDKLLKLEESTAL